MRLFHHGVEGCEGDAEGQARKVGTVASFDQGEARLTTLYLEALSEQGSVVVSPFVWGLGVHVFVERPVLIKVGGRQVTVQRTEHDPRRWHYRSPSRAGATLRK